MRVGRRSAVAGFVSPLAAAAIALGTATPATAAVAPPPVPGCTAEAKCNALLLGGTGSGRLTDQQMEDALDGYFADDARFTRQNVRYPGTWDFLPSIGIGALILGGELNKVLVADPDALIVIGGFSQGAAVASQLLYRLELMGDNAPDKSQLRFVLVSDPYRGPNTGITNWLAPETKYDLIVVAAEYDGIADAPDRWWNVLANWNASLGALYLHVSTTDANLDDVPEENITVYAPNSKGGVITKYLIPTETLPLVKFMPWLAPYEETLKRIVDAGYSRNDETGEQDALRAASRKVEEVSEETLPQESAETTEASADADAAPSAPEQQIEAAGQELAPKAEEVVQQPAEDDATEVDATESESESESTGSHRAKRGTEKKSVAEIKSRLADEAKAEAETKAETTAETKSVDTRDTDSKSDDGNESQSPEKNDSSTAGGADRDAA